MTMTIQVLERREGLVPSVIQNQGHIIEIDAVNGDIYLSGDIDVPANLHDTFRFVSKFRSRIIGGWDIYNKQGSLYHDGN